MLLDNHHLVDKQNHASKIKIHQILFRQKNKHTPSLTAFRRKNALHAAHVGTAKLIPTALSSHIKH